MPAPPSVRVTLASMAVMLKILTRARVTVIAVLVQPAVLAVIVAETYRAGGRAELSLAALLGTAVVGAWTSVLFFAGGMLSRERRQGTLQILVSTPAPLGAVVVGGCLAAAVLSLYSLATVVAVGTIGYGVPLRIVQPAVFVLAVLVMVGGMAVLGVPLSALFVLYRQAGMFQNALEYPVWLVCGLLIPFPALPVVLRVLGAGLEPTWAAEALRRSAAGSGPWPSLAVSVLLATAYLLIGWRLLRLAERRARVDATLPLA